MPIDVNCPEERLNYLLDQTNTKCVFTNIPDKLHINKKDVSVLDLRYISIENVIQYFRDNNADCGVVCFESIHPRWSYVKIQGIFYPFLGMDS